VHVPEDSLAVLIEGSHAASERLLHPNIITIGSLTCIGYQEIFTSGKISLGGDGQVIAVGNASHGKGRGNGTSM
jgi:hypothetical protein